MRASLKQQLILILSFGYTFSVFAQPNTTIDLSKEKSEKNKEKLLAAEKTGDKKLTVTKKFFNKVELGFLI